MSSYYDNDKYPSPSKQTNRPDPKVPTPSGKGFAQTKTVKAGECLDEPEKAKVKAAYGQTKGLLWYRYIK
jgi:hypothetical protein|tara:strand:+ start:683 stop:892 length:210 start_codon:yes stop_codon:yes gene_type:complete